MKKSEYVYIIGEPDLNIIAFASNIINIYSVVNEMRKKNWSLSIMQNPPSFHFCITDLHNKDICKQFCKDLNNSCEYVSQNKQNDLSGTLAIYGAENNIEKNLFIDEIINDYIFLLSQRNISFRYI